MRRLPAALFLAAGLLAALAACSAVPGTGRNQLLLLSSSQEMNLGAEAYEQMLAEEAILTRGDDAEMVSRIGARIAVAAEELYPDSLAKDFAWEFKLIDDPDMVNAWALPGGKCAVYTGLLPVTGDEDSLAVVMGHEVAHAIARHGGERMSHSVVLQGALVGAAISTRKMDREERTAVMAALGIGSQVGVMLPFSRAHESEADELGLYLAAYAGYDPRASIGLWERMGASGGARPPEWLSTHPSEQTRIKRLRGHMPKALEYYEQSQQR
jgi:predicted Zn-dependent protease